MRTQKYLKNLLKRLRGFSKSHAFSASPPEPEPLLVMDNQLLFGKNVLITGAGRNIGRSIALEMAKQGANVFFTEIDQGRCDQLAKELRNYPIRSRGFACDSSKREEIDRLYDSLSQHDVAIDVLVNNAGIQIETTTIKELKIDEWQQTFDTNLFGPLYLTKRVALEMMAHSIKGSILFITSIHQWQSVGWASYSASKAALGMIIKELAVELASHGIRVNGIAPGWVAEDEEGNPFHSKYSLLHKVSVKPCYIGRAAVYLASDYFSLFTTGSVLKIDAGMSLYNHGVAVTHAL